MQNFDLFRHERAEIFGKFAVSVVPEHDPSAAFFAVNLFERFGNLRDVHTKIISMLFKNPCSQLAECVENHFISVFVIEFVAGIDVG